MVHVSKIVDESDSKISHGPLQHYSGSSFSTSSFSPIFTVFLPFFSIVTQYLHCIHFQKIVEYSTGFYLWFSPSPNIEVFHIKKFVYISLPTLLFIFLQTQKTKLLTKMMCKCAIKVFEIFTR